jgi:hypothetical protein
MNFELESGAVLWLTIRPTSWQGGAAAPPRWQAAQPHGPSFLAVGYPSGQRGQTVNLLAYAFDGSNPSPTTTPKPTEECRFYSMFIILLLILVVLHGRAFVLFASLAFPSETMLTNQS